ncbi:MAG: response regulator transcription factor [Leadbetterella sp.]|nr:response regulator transcription factor [Leadbetterella sp.]
MKTLIIEDVQKDSELLQLLLTRNHPEIEITGTARGALSGYKLILEQRPHLVFMDIEIEERGTSFDIIDRLLNEGIPINFDVVFMTAHKQYDYTTRAFEYAAVDYITKPIDPHSLARAIERTRDRQQHKNAGRVLQELVNILKADGSKSSVLSLPLAHHDLRMVQIEDIRYIKADSVVSHFYMSNGEKIIAFRPLSVYRKLLEADHNFFSISQSLTVNLNYMERYNHKHKTLNLTDGEVLHASRMYGTKLYTHLRDTNRIKPPSLLERIRQKLLTSF